jgi:glycosyltransferase involved in cell wall biosynthesis
MNKASKRVAIFTNFNTADPAYSLNRVVQDQIKMLLHNGYENVKVVVAESFQPVEMYEQVELVYIPNVPCHNEVKKDESFDQDVDLIYESLKTALKDVDVVLTHDIVYQPACLKHNFAAREFAKENTQIKWLHWIHSATSPTTLNALIDIFGDKYLDVIRTEFPNSFYIFFNHYSIPRVAQNFGVAEEKVKVVHHPLDVCGFFGVDQKVAEFVDEKKLLEADAICVYPCRLDRGKQVEMAIKTMAKLKDFHMKVRMIVVDFHSTGGDKVVYRDELKATGIDWGLNSVELSFTSEFCQEWYAQVPHNIVKDLMMFANVMIMPSRSESYSLVTQEAAALGKIVVLNWDFPPFRDIFGESAIYRKYSSNVDIMNGLDGNTFTNYGPDDVSPEERKHYERNYHKDTAGMIAYRLKNYENLVLQRKILKERNLDAVFKNELEPLFYE